MKIKLLGYVISNLRSFRNIEISLDEKKITIIMMPNGTGKTTSIELIKYALTGIMSDKNAIHSFKPNFNSYENSEFILRLGIDEECFVIRIQFDFIDNSVRYFYTDTKTGLEVKRPLEFDLFTEEFVEKFIFDGELAKEFLNSESAYAEESVMNIYHLEKLENLSKKIDKLKSVLIQESSETSASNESGYTRHTNELNALENKQKHLVEQANKMKKEISKYDEQISSIDTEIDKIFSSNKSIQDSIEKHNKAISKLENELKTLLTSIAQNSLFVHNVSKKIWQDNRALIDVLVQMKLPKSVSEQFFVDIINHANTCICGRKLDDCDREFIKNNYEKYLEENNISILNEVKSYALNIDYSPEITFLLDESREKEREIKREEQKLEKAKLQIDNEQKLKKEKLDTEKDKLVRERELINNSYQRITCEDEYLIKNYKDDENLKKIKVKIDKLKNIIEQVERNRKINYNAEILNKVINSTKIRLLDNIKKDVLTKTNEKVRKIIQNDNIEVESIDKYIKIRNREGISVGQSLSVSYSFISALFENSFYKLPFVIDSPAGSLDNDYRYEVAQIIPKVFDQLILFVISSEKPHFTDVVSNIYNNDVTHYTIYRTDDGLILNDDETFFNTFQDRS